MKGQTSLSGLLRETAYTARCGREKLHSLADHVDLTGGDPEVLAWVAKELQHGHLLHRLAFDDLRWIEELVLDATGTEDLLCLSGPCDRSVA